MGTNANLKGVPHRYLEKLGPKVWRLIHHGLPWHALQWAQSLCEYSCVTGWFRSAVLERAHLLLADFFAAHHGDGFSVILLSSLECLWKMLYSYTLNNSSIFFSFSAKVAFYIFFSSFFPLANNENFYFQIIVLQIKSDAENQFERKVPDSECKFLGFSLAMKERTCARGARDLLMGAMVQTEKEVLALCT